MKKLHLISLVLILGLVSCAYNQKSDKGNIPSLATPKTLNDEWSKWLIGDWQGWAKSDFGKNKNWVIGNCRLHIQLDLDNQFLIREGWSRVLSLSDEYVNQLKSQGLTYPDIEKMRNKTFRSMEIYTLDPKTGEIAAYLFDSFRCVAKGTGKHVGNKETINWVWSVGGQGSSTRVTEKISNNKFRTVEKYSLPGGGTMEDTMEMTREY